MRAAIPFVIAITATVSASAHAGHLSLIGSTGAYMGEAALGVVYESESHRHGIALAVGRTQDELMGEVRQYTLGYNFIPMMFWDSRWASWYPLVTGLYVTTTDHDEFESGPSGRFEQADYDQNGYRALLLVGTRVNFRVGSKRLHLSFINAMVDQGVIQLWNNGWTKETPLHISSGVVLGLEFF